MVALAFAHLAAEAVPEGRHRVDHQVALASVSASKSSIGLAPLMPGRRSQPIPSFGAGYTFAPEG